MTPDALTRPAPACGIFLRCDRTEETDAKPYGKTDSHDRQSCGERNHNHAGYVFLDRINCIGKRSLHSFCQHSLVLLSGHVWPMILYSIKSDL